MELDKRFKVLPFCCFGAEKCVKYIGHKGYFSNNIALFKNIDLCIDGTLEAVHGDEAESFEMRDNRKFYRYFIPECFVKPKEKQYKYRPYTFMEFNDKFTIGCSIITFRRKAYAELIHNVLFIGYREDKEGLILLLGNAGYSLEELFNEYEYQNTLGKWIPFGVEE